MPAADFMTAYQHLIAALPDVPQQQAAAGIAVVAVESAGAEAGGGGESSGAAKAAAHAAQALANEPQHHARLGLLYLAQPLQVGILV